MDLQDRLNEHSQSDQVLLSIHCLHPGESWKQTAEKGDVVRAFARCYSLRNESPEQIVANGRTLRDAVEHQIHILCLRGHIRSKHGLVWLTRDGRREADRILGEQLIVDPSIADRIGSDPHKTQAEAGNEEEFRGQLLEQRIDLGRGRER
jgi:hypothetical protein